MKKFEFGFFFLIVFHILSSCSDQESQKQEFDLTSEYYLLQKAQETEDLEEKLKLYDEGLKTVKNNDTLRSHYYHSKIDVFNELGKYDSAIFYSDSLIKLTKKTGTPSFEASAYFSKIEPYKGLNNYQEVFRNAYKARNFYLKAGDSSMAGRSTLQMSVAQDKMADYRNSQQSATQALSLLDPKKDSVYLSSAYDIIGRAYRYQGFLEDAISEYQNSMRYAEHKLCVLTIKNNIAQTLIDLGQEQEAVDLLEQITNQTDDPKFQIFFEDNLIFGRWIINPGLDIETELLSNLEKRKEIGNKVGIIGSYEHLMFFYKDKNKEKAIEMAKKLLAVATEIERENSQKLALEQLIALSAPEESKKYSERYIILSDSIESNNLRVQNTFAKIKYDEEQKLDEINQLEAQAAIKDQETIELKNQLIILLLILIILGGITAVYFYTQKQRHRREKLKEVYQTEIRLSKTVHDELANDIYNLMSRLQPILAPAEIDKLDNIYKKTRDISRKNNSVDTGNSYSGNLLAMVSENTPPGTRLFINGHDSIVWNNYSREQKIVIFRVLQELFINLQKHSEAKNVALIFKKINKTLHITYSDNGIGFDPNLKRTRNGLLNTENRISSIGGSITFDSEPEKGLKVDIKIPG